jgi:hypothetical protein
MATSFSRGYKIKLIGTGLEAGTWGTSTNENLKRIDQALAGAATSFNMTSPSAPSSYTSNTLSWCLGDTTDAWEAGSEARNRYVNFTGSVGAHQTVRIHGTTSSVDGVDRVYFVKNGLSGGDYTITFKGASGDTGVALNVGATAMIYDASGTVENALGKLQLDGLEFNASSDISILDNDASALDITEDTNSYLKFTTTNSSEAVVVGQKLDIDDAEIDVATQATGIAIKDNEAAALDITEASNSYLKFTTTNSSEAVVVGQTLDIDSASIDVATQATSISIKDNEAASLDIKEASNSYLKFTTTNSSEAVVVGQTLDIDTATVDLTTQATAMSVNTSSTTALDIKDGGTSLLAVDTTNNQVVMPTVDIGGGAIDGTIIGAASAAAGTFTDATADDVVVAGTDGYINFVTGNGDSGYGIKNASGTIQAKNDSGAWADLLTVVGTIETPDSSGAALNKEGRFTVGPVKFYFNRYNVTGDDTIDLNGEFSIIWTVLATQSQRDSQDKNIEAWVDASTNTSIHVVSPSTRQVTVLCIGLPD